MTAARIDGISYINRKITTAKQFDIVTIFFVFIFISIGGHQ